MKVIFDTNAAREYISRVPHANIEDYARINAKKMKDSNIDLIVNPIVIMELMYHLLDKNDKDYYVSYNTIKALMLTVEYQSKDGLHTTMAVAECLIARDLFNMRIEERELMYSKLMSGASFIAKKGIDNIDTFTSTNGMLVKEYVESVENSFVEQTKKTVNMLTASGFNNSDFTKSNIYESLLAIYIIRTTYNLLINEKKIYFQERQLLNRLFSNGQMLSMEDFVKLLPSHPELKAIYDMMIAHSQIIIKKYPAFIALFKEVMLKVQNGMSDEKIKNYIWDILLMFNVTGFTINREPVVFVTSDKAMLQAANISHKHLSIMTFEELKDKYLQ